MIRLRKKHSHYYIALFLLLLVGLLMSLFFSPNKQTQVAFIVLTALIYVFSGILHHIIDHDISLKIMVEYILIGSLGISIMLFLLKGNI